MDEVLAEFVGRYPRKSSRRVRQSSTLTRWWATESSTSSTCNKEQASFACLRVSSFYSFMLSTMLCCRITSYYYVSEKIKPWICVSRFRPRVRFFFCGTDGYFCCSKRTHRHRTAASIGSQSIQLMYRATLCIYFISSCTTQVARVVHELMTETTCDLACFHGNNAAR